MKIAAVGNGSDGFAVNKLGTYDYDGKMRNILIAPGSKNKRGGGDFLTPDGQFELRYELWKLTRVSIIPRPVALYGASLASRTFGDAEADL